MLTGGVLLLLGGGLMLQQLITASKHRSGGLAASKMELYTYPGNYKQDISHYYSYYLDSLNRPDVQDAIRLNNEGKFIAWYKPGMAFNLGMQRSYTWFYLPVKNESARDICLVWQLLNGIDTARLFCKTGGQILQHPVISAYTPLNRRSIPLRGAIDTVWIKPGEQTELYLHVSKSAYNTYMPFSVLPVAELLQKESFTTNIYCVYVAVFAFIILFNLFLFISLRDPIHLWYPFFIFNITMGLLLEVYYDVSLFPEFLHRIFALTYNTPFADFSLLGTGRVMQLLLQQKRGNSPFWPVFTFFLATDFIWGCAQLLSATCCVHTGWHYNYFLFRSVSDVLLWGTTALLVCGVIEKVIQGQPLARIYLFTTMLPTLGILNFFMNGIGMTDFVVLYPNGFAVGVMLEILMLTMLLKQRYNLLQREKNELLNRQLELQLEMSDRVAETLENEQKRIAADLHDGLGSFLTALRLMVNKSLHYFTDKGQTESAETLKTIQGQIDKAVDEIRTISHNLMPYDFEHQRFTEIIKNHLTAISSATQLNVEYYLDEQIDSIPKSIQITLYRIFTEIMNNALKHSKSDNITVQFISHDSTLQMQVVDEGAGFDKDAGVAGIGLKNIRSRVDFLKGKLSIDSGEKGTTLIVEIPLA